MTKPHPKVQQRIALARNVASFAPHFRGLSRWAREVSLLTAAYCYTYRPELHIMTDREYDALANVICRSKDTSPYFKECVNMAALRKTGSSTAINFGHGIAQLTADMFKPGWTPGKQDILDGRRLHERMKTLSPPLTSDPPKRRTFLAPKRKLTGFSRATQRVI